MYAPNLHTDFDWDTLNLFGDEVGWDLVFQLSALRRHGNRTASRWDPTNAMELMEYNEKRGYKIHFTLGNGKGGGGRGGAMMN